MTLNDYMLPSVALAPRPDQRSGSSNPGTPLETHPACIQIIKRK